MVNIDWEQVGKCGDPDCALDHMMCFDMDTEEVYGWVDGPSRQGTFVGIYKNGIFGEYKSQVGAMQALVKVIEEGGVKPKFIEPPLDFVEKQARMMARVMEEEKQKVQAQQQDKKEDKKEEEKKDNGQQDANI